MRLRLFAAVALVATAIAVVYVLRPVVLPEEPGPVPCVGPDCGPAGVTAEQQLAQRYVPVVYLADSVTDCSLTSGDFRPVPVEIVLGNIEVTLRDRSGNEAVKPAPAAFDLYNKGPEFYLDFPGNPRRPGCRFLRDGAEFATGAPNIAYARLTTEEGFSELVLQYWFFFYFNQWNNKHEGDWEMVQLVFAAASAQEALEQEPLRVAYSQHSGGELASWDAGKLEKEDHRPVIHVAAGSHGNYFSQRVFIGRAEQGAGFGCDDATGETRLSLEPRLLPETIYGPDDPYAWLTFQGRWGDLAGTEFDGPTGPNMKQQWSQPLTWEERLRTSSVRLPSRETIGPNGIEAFCDVVAWASNLILPVYLRLPEVTIGAFALISFGMVASLTRTQFVPVRRRPMRQRRRIGQALLSAALVYSMNPRLFVGIGLLFLPVAITVSILHWLVFSISPVEPVVPLPRGNPAGDIALTLALSQLQFGIAYTIVVAACTVAVGAIDAGRPATVRDCFVTVWRQLLDLALPRAASYAIAVVLVFSVIGIPLAVRQAVRWSFIEQAVLLDGAGRWNALQLSSDAADRDWWWTAACVSALTALGLFMAPAAGIFLLLAAPSIPLSDVNLITSVIHVAFVPFVSIAFALIYFDLTSRPRPAEADDPAVIAHPDAPL